MGFAIFFFALNCVLGLAGCIIIFFLIILLLAILEVGFDTIKDAIIDYKKSRKLK